MDGSCFARCPSTFPDAMTAAKAVSMQRHKELRAEREAS
jgi:hypothetical protein